MKQEETINNNRAPSLTKGARKYSVGNELL